MANISYGVNLLPKTNNAYTLGNSDYKWSNIYTVQLNGVNVANLATNSVATSSAAGLMSAADKAKLDTLSAFNATDYTVNIATTDWVNNSYTWTNAAVTATSYIIVNFTSSVNDYVKGMLDYTKVSGGVQFNVESTPTDTITLIVGVIDGASGTSIIGEANIDVQINGTSILSNGVANIPEASSETYGALKTGYTTSGLQKDVGGYLKIYPATSDNIKAGTEVYRPIVPYHQHESIFYGLAKAAGVDMASSSNEVGVYTDAAKTAIQSMLAVSSSNNPIFTGSFSQNRKSNTTIGTNSFSSGDNCEASAEDSHAEGRYTVASGYYSHAEGNYTTASGMASHAAGTVTVANHASQYTFGEYNVEDSSSASALTRGNYIEIVGNGTASNAKSNARTLDWNGNEYLNGYLYVGCDADSTDGIRIPHDIQINNTSIVSNGIAAIPIANTSACGVIKVNTSGTHGLSLTDGELYIYPAGLTGIKNGSDGYLPIVASHQHEATFYGLAKAAGDSTQSASSNAVGVYTDNAKNAIQNMLNVLSATDPVITGSISQARLVNSPIGYNSIALGESCQASGSHSLAFGYQCSATGPSAHAEGYLTSAGGLYSVSMGLSTVSMYQTETVIGRYNSISRFQDMTSWESGVSYSAGDKVWWSPYILICKEDHTSSGTEPPESLWAQDLGTLFVVGNGMTGATRSNALTLTHEGKLLIADYLYVGANANGEGGYRIPHDIQVNGTSIVNNGIANILLPTKVSDLTNDSGFLTSVPVMTGATSSTAGTSGLVPVPGTTDVDKFLAGDGTYKSGGLPMVILSYGNSTWADFEAAYNNHVIVYCRASSNSNPKTGSQTRMAFMAYVNNAESPTNVEFQYYRSMNSHSGTQMGDQVYVYKLDKTSGWSVTTREAGLKQITAGTGINVSYNNNTINLENTADLRCWELIKEGTFTNETEANYEITTDANDQAFSLTDIVLMFETPVQETDAAKGGYGQVQFYYESQNNNYFSSESGAWTQAANTIAHGFVVKITQEPGGLFFCQETQAATSSNSAPWRSRYSASFETDSQGIRFFTNNYVRNIFKIIITKVTGTGHYKLIGKRAAT